MGIAFYVPLVIVLVYLPLISVVAIRMNQFGNVDAIPMDKSYLAFLFSIEVALPVMTLLPFFSILWPLFISREAVESHGYELLHIMGKRKVWYAQLAFFTLYVILVALLFIGYNLHYGTFVWLHFFRLVAIFIYLFGLMKALLLISHSSGITLLVLLVFVLVNHVMLNQNGTYPFYFKWGQLEGLSDLIPNLAHACTGVLLLLITTYVPFRDKFVPVS